MKTWRIVLAVWFLLYGLLTVSNVRFQFQDFLLGVLALGAAVLILWDK